MGVLAFLLTLAAHIGLPAATVNGDSLGYYSCAFRPLMAR